MSENTKQEDGVWWESLYDELLANVLLENGNPKEIEKTIELLEKVLDLSPGDSIFDQCCGTGRLSVPLAKKGYRVTGIDLVDGYIDTARTDAAQLGVDQHTAFAAADAFKYRCEQPCSAGLNWWTSFGYTPSDTENLKMLSRAFESVVPRGKFALDFMNVPGVLHHFKPQVVTRGHSKEEGEILLVRDSEVDVANGIMRKEWNYYLESGRRIRHSSAVRLYDPPALRGLFERAGFTDIQIFGDLDASSISLNSPRCIVVGQRPD